MRPQTPPATQPEKNESPEIMFNPEHAREEAETPTASTTPKSPQVGAPVDARRVGRALTANNGFTYVLVGASIAGVGARRSVLPRTYAANATLLWEPPAALHGEAAHEPSRSRRA